MKELNGCCILVVEDEYYLARDLQQTLKAAGARVMGPFPGEEEALAAMERDPPHCAIIDVNLGGGAEFALADVLQARGVPFLFFTGYDREVIPARFSGVTRLEKPVDATRLMRAARAICESPLERNAYL